MPSLAALTPEPVLDAFNAGVEVGVAIALLIVASLAVLAMIRRMLSV